MISFFGAVREEILTKLLTMILLSPVALGALPDEGLAAAPRAGLVFFLTPPTGAGAAGRAVLRVERRPPAGVRLLVERISSRDWSSLPDMLMLVMMSVGETMLIQSRECGRFGIARCCAWIATVTQRRRSYEARMKSAECGKMSRFEAVWWLLLCGLHFDGVAEGLKVWQWLSLVVLRKVKRARAESKMADGMNVVGSLSKVVADLGDGRMGLS